MPMLGTNPRTFDNGRTFIRKSLAVARGLQAFWTSRDGGMGLGVDHIGNLHPELIPLGCDTIVLNPVDYEAVMKSMQETPARDRARAMRARSGKELASFDAVSHMKKRMEEEHEHRLASGKGAGT